MAILSTGYTYSDNDQVTSTRLNAAINSATFDSGAVDNSTTQLSGGAIIVKDSGISASKLATSAVTTAKINDAAVTAAKISAGGPSWDATGNTVITGTTTNDNAATGKVGEYVSSTVAAASRVGLTSATTANVTSISLTAGDWDVCGDVLITADGAFNIAGAGTPAYAAIATTSATLPGFDVGRQAAILPLAGNGYDYHIVTPLARISIASTTTVYLVANATHNASSSEVGASGTLRARRVR